MGKLNSSNPPFGEIKMRPELQAKLLQHLNKKKADEGFTLVELLVVVIIIGILAAIALPSYLNLTASSKQSEGRQNITSLVHAQQVWIAENNGYASTFDVLAVGVVKGAGSTDTTTSTIYDYSMAPLAGLAAGNNGMGMGAKSRTDAKVKGYTGGVNTYQNASGQTTYSSATCEAAIPGTSIPATVVVATAVASETPFAATGGGGKAKVAGDIACVLTSQNEIKTAGK
jgi:type IV pilus assembly protein PilA